MYILTDIHPIFTKRGNGNMLYIADFETVVLEDTTKQKETCVWAYGFAQLFDGTENVNIGNSIDGFFDTLCQGKRKEKKIVYFVNLKFDGSFILDYLLRVRGFQTAYNDETKQFKQQKDLKPGEITYVITDLGIWYQIAVNINGYMIEFRDTLKLLPFSVSDLSEAFDCKHKKLDMEYIGDRKPHGVITMEERKYIANDILVPKEALEKFLTEIDSKKTPPLTIAQASLKDYFTQFTKQEIDTLFPNLAENYGGLEQKDFINKFGCNNADEYIRRSYYGGWCYCEEKYSGIINGTTDVYDVNSLYPGEMEKDENVMPIGEPTFTKNPKFLKYMTKDHYYIIRFRCKFNLKSFALPFVQLKYDCNYRSNENLRTSNFDRFGAFRTDLKPTLTLTKTMFEMFIRFYNIKEFEFLDACYFNTEKGLFKQYINKWKRRKIEADKEGNVVKRTICKLFLNSLYGRFGRNPDNTFKVIENDLESEMALNYIDHKGDDVKPLYIPIATAITSYARRFTVTCAIENKEYFRYSDTDSIHICAQEGYTPKGMIIHESDFGTWKHESRSKNSLFLRQKTYIEFTDNKYDIKACGMPDRSKIIFAENLKGNKPKGGVLTYYIEKKKKGVKTVEKKLMKLSKHEQMFFSRDRSPQDFKVGFSVPGKLLPRLIKGGTVLIEVDFTIK